MTIKVWATNKIRRFNSMIMTIDRHTFHISYIVYVDNIIELDLIGPIVLYLSTD